MARQPAAGHLGMTTGALRAVVILVVITVGLSATTWYHGNTQAGRLAAAQHAQAQTSRKLNRTVRQLDAVVAKLRREVRANCDLDHVLSPLPVTVPPGARKASLLGVEIVDSFRRAWRKAGCIGPLPPPAPSLVKWAHYYGRKVQR